MNYQEVLDFLYTQLPMYQRMGKVAFKKDLINTLKLADRTGNPHQSLRAIHVAGTNGKGSTSHLIAAVLQAAGFKVGLYTSPHLRSFRERIRINGEQVEEDYVTDFVNSNKNHILDIKPSFFEITVVMAFDYFAKRKVDFAVIETGLGGRLDSTNIVLPLVSIITSISLDHEDMLGNTLAAIAYEKAGIIKEGVPVIVGELPKEAEHVIRLVAVQKNAKFIEQRTSSIESYDSDLPQGVLNLNLSTVLNVCSELQNQGVKINKEDIQHGIGHVVKLTGLRGRWQVIGSQPMIIADVGHNEEAVEWIMSSLQQYTYRQLHMVWGVTADKSVDKIFPLMIKDCKYYFCAADVPRAMNTIDLKEQAGKFNLHGNAYASVDEAYKSALSSANKEDLIFVGGSTFVVAEIKDL